MYPGKRGGIQIPKQIVISQYRNIVNEAAARKKATEWVKQANTQMTLEAQTLSSEKIKFEIDRLTQDMLKRMPSNFCDN